MYVQFTGNKKYVFIEIVNTPVPLYGHHDQNCYLPLLAFIDGIPFSVFNGKELIDLCKENSCHFIIGLASNPML